MATDKLQDKADISVDVSVILPALTLADDFYRCIYSIRTALRGKLGYEIIVVVPRCDEFSELVGTDIRIISQQDSGIYAAMNTGLNSAIGNYIYFIGQDDIMLSTADKAVKQGIEEGSDLILSDVYWGNVGRFRNWPWRSSLVWRNWCHQGILYKRGRFLKEIRSFPVQYRAQGDHYVNIIFSGLPGVRISKYQGCIAWYSSEGYSSNSPDMVFRAAFPSIIYKHYGVLSYLMVIVRRALLGIVVVARRSKKI